MPFHSKAESLSEIQCIKACYNLAKLHDALKVALIVEGKHSPSTPGFPLETNELQPEGRNA